MSEPIIISELKGIWQNIAKACDANNDGKLEQTSLFDEIAEYDRKCEDFKNAKLESSSVFSEYNIAPSDNTRVARPIIADELVMKSSTQLLDDATLKKLSFCKKMKAKWSNVFKNSPLSETFYSKLYDVLDTLKVKVSDKSWDKANYTSPKEQAMDEVLAMLAGEAKLNPKTIGYVGKTPTFFGLFQLSKEGLSSAKKWAKEHPEVAGMARINQNMTLQNFQKLKGEEQLDYLVAYIGASKEASKISKDESVSPAKLWSMVKLPNLNENDPKKRARRQKTIIQKQDSIVKVFTNNRIPRGAV